VLAVVSLGGCVEHPYVWVNDLPRSTELPGTIEPRDTLLVLVRNQTALSGEFVVRDDGAFLQPTVGNVQAAGKRPEAVAAELAARLKDMVVVPEVSIAILKVATIRVDVRRRGQDARRLRPDPRSRRRRGPRGRGVVDGLRAPRSHLRRPGGAERRIRFQAAALTTAEPHAATFRLHDGDVVVVE